MNNSHEMNFVGGGVMGSTSLPDSSISRKTAHVVRDQFPVGLRVLVVDDDRTCLTILEQMLRKCRYETTKCKRAKEALEMLRENKNRFDVVISDVHMPDMDGFRLLESIGLEMDLPVIMMSADDSSHVVMKGVTHGACDYLIKPVRIEALKNIWQHVVRKKQNEIKDIEQLSSLDDGDRQHQQDENEYLSPANEGNWKSAKRKGDEEESEDNTNTATLKKPRVVWSVELHQQFVAAVNQLGIDKAVPKKILELMNFHGLTRENVASHLQKYRLYLRRLSGVPQHHSGLNNAFMGPQDSAFAAMPSLGRIDYQALAVTAQLPAQTLAAYQAGVGCSGVKPGITMPFVDQRNLFSFESSKLRHGERQQLSNSDKQMNLLHGIPTSMEPKQLASLHQSAAHPMRGVNMQMGGAHCGQSGSVLMQMVQSQSRGHLLNESVGSQASQMQSSSGQTLPSNTASVGILSRIGIAENPTSGLSYNPVTHSSSMVDFSVNKIIVDLPGNGFPLGGTPGMNSLISEGGLVPGELKMSHIGESNGGFAPSYDIFNYRQQNRSRDYQLQNSSAMSSYGASHSQPMTPNMHNINVSPSVLVHQAFSSGHQKNEQSGNALIGKTTVFSAGPNHHQQGIPFNTKQHLNSFDNSSMSTKEGRLQDIGTGTNLFQEQYGQDDLLSAILKQQQDLTAGECYLDDYHLDNFHVNEVLTSQ